MSSTAYCLSYYMQYICKSSSTFLVIVDKTLNMRTDTLWNASDLPSIWDQNNMRVPDHLEHSAINKLRTRVHPRAENHIFTVACPHTSQIQEVFTSTSVILQQNSCILYIREWGRINIFIV